MVSVLFLKKTLKLIPFIEAIFCKYFGHQTKCEYFTDFSNLNSISNVIQSTKNSFIKAFTFEWIHAFVNKSV